MTTAPLDHPALETAVLTQLAQGLEQLASWVRRATPKGQFSSVAHSTLAALERHGPQRIGELVQRERITQPGMTSTVTRLADAGLVDRAPDPTDGRAQLVSITESGRRYLARLHAVRAEIVAQAVRELPADQQRGLAAGVTGLFALAATEPPTDIASRSEEVHSTQ